MNILFLLPILVIFFLSAQATAKPLPSHRQDMPTEHAKACQGMPRQSQGMPRQSQGMPTEHAKAKPRHRQDMPTEHAKAKPRQSQGMPTEQANRAGQQSRPTEQANRACQGKAKAKARHMPHSKKAGTLLIVLEYLLKFPFIQACRYKWLQEPHQQQQSETSSQGTAHWP